MASAAADAGTSVAAPAAADDAGDADPRQRAVCAIGLLRPPNEPLLMGSGFCIDASRRVFCSCAHTWGDIENAALLRKWIKLYDVSAGYLYKGPKSGGGTAYNSLTPTGLVTANLDPYIHGVAIGFQPTDRGRARLGEVDWVGRAKLISPPGALYPVDDGLDLVVLQLVQDIDGAPLGSGLSLVALPLGEPDSLWPGDQLYVLGFGVPEWEEDGKLIAKRRGDARPRYPKFSTMTDGDSGRWIETTMDESKVYSGHSGGPLLGPRGDVMGWVVVTNIGIDHFRPVDTRFEAELKKAFFKLELCRTRYNGATNSIYAELFTKFATMELRTWLKGDGRGMLGLRTTVEEELASLRRTVEVQQLEAQQEAEAAAARAEAVEKRTLELAVELVEAKLARHTSASQPQKRKAADAPTDDSTGSSSAAASDAKRLRKGRDRIEIAFKATSERLKSEIEDRSRFKEKLLRQLGCQGWGARSPAKPSQARPTH